MDSLGLGEELTLHVRERLGRMNSMSYVTKLKPSLLDDAHVARVVVTVFNGVLPLHNIIDTRNHCGSLAKIEGQSRISDRA